MAQGTSGKLMTNEEIRLQLGINVFSLEVPLRRQLRPFLLPISSEIITCCYLARRLLRITIVLSVATVC